MDPKEIDKLADEVWKQKVSNFNEVAYLEKIKKHFSECKSENGKLGTNDIIGSCSAIALTESVKMSFNMTVEMLKILLKDK